MRREKPRSPREHIPKRGLLWMLYSYIAGFGLQALYFIVLARLLAPEQYGMWAGAQATAVVAATLAGVGAGNVMVVDVARNRDAFPTAFGYALRHFAVTVPVLVLIAGLVGLLISPAFFWLSIVLGVGEVAGNKLSDVATQAAQANRALHLAAHFNVCLVGLRFLGASVTVAFLGDLPAISWGVVYAAISVAAALILVFVIVRRFGMPKGGDGEGLRYWRLGGFFSLGMASRIIYNDADKYLLNLYSLTAVAGNYSAAYRLTNIAFAPMQALVYSSNVDLYARGEGGFARVWQLVRRLLRFQLAVAVVVTILTFILAPIVPLVLGSSYSSSVEMLQIVCLVLPFQAIHYLFGDALMGLGRQGVRSLLQFAMAVVSVVLNLFFIPVFGWQASAWISVGTAFGLSVLTVIVFLRGISSERTSRELQAG